MLVALLFGCLLPVLSGCSNVLGLPKSGAVQVMKPTEQDTRRIFTNPSGPVKDAQPEAIVKGFFEALPAGVQSDGFKTARRFLTSAASNWWNSDAKTMVYSGAPQIARKASFADSSAVNDEITVSVRLQVQGMLDSHGVYLAVPELQYIWHRFICWCVYISCFAACTGFRYCIRFFGMCGCAGGLDLYIYL